MISIVSIFFIEFVGVQNQQIVSKMKFYFSNSVLESIYFISFKLKILEINIYNNRLMLISMETFSL
jgi:hypothetical protein